MSDEQAMEIEGHDPRSFQPSRDGVRFRPITPVTLIQAPSLSPYSASPSPQSCADKSRRGAESKLVQECKDQAQTYPDAPTALSRMPSEESAKVKTTLPIVIGAVMPSTQSVTAKSESAEASPCLQADQLHHIRGRDPWSDLRISRPLSTTLSASVNSAGVTGRMVYMATHRCSILRRQKADKNMFAAEKNKSLLPVNEDNSFLNWLQKGPTSQQIMRCQKLCSDLSSKYHKSLSEVYINSMPAITQRYNSDGTASITESKSVFSGPLSGYSLQRC